MTGPTPQKEESKTARHTYGSTGIAHPAVPLYEPLPATLSPRDRLLHRVRHAQHPVHGPLQRGVLVHPAWNVGMGFVGHPVAALDVVLCHVLELPAVEMGLDERKQQLVLVLGQLADVPDQLPHGAVELLRLGAAGQRVHVLELLPQGDVVVDPLFKHVLGMVPFRPAAAHHLVLLPRLVLAHQVAQHGEQHLLRGGGLDGKGRDDVVHDVGARVGRGGLVGVQVADVEGELVVGDPLPFLPQQVDDGFVLRGDGRLVGYGAGGGRGAERAARHRDSRRARNHGGRQRRR
ncbi:hypothetical protein DFJ74DRAFT_684109 [Hyaloraphidium curvatum]|nr:hypothetical protein DFJ74DRAFT_684109 [Hyaloraphidium curvatum]